MTIALAMGGKAFGRGQLLAAAPGPEGAAFLLHSVLLQDHSVLLQERYRNRIDEIERLFFMHQVFKFFGRCFTKSLMIVRICRARSDCREGRKVMARTEWENSRCSSNQEGSGSIASSAAVTNRLAAVSVRCVYSSSLIPCAVARRPVSRSHNSQSCSTKSFNDTRSSAPPLSLSSQSVLSTRFQ